MKKTLSVLILILTFLLALAGCTKSNDKNTLYEEYVVNFVSEFSGEYQSANFLGDNLSHFACWQIYNEQNISTNEFGYINIPEALLKNYITSHFGDIEIDYLEEYDTETNSYIFYPLGEESLNQVEILNVSSKNNTLTYHVQVKKLPFSTENGETITLENYYYTFAIENDVLKFISSSKGIKM